MNQNVNVNCAISLIIDRTALNLVCVSKRPFSCAPLPSPFLVKDCLCLYHDGVYCANTTQTTTLLSQEVSTERERREKKRERERRERSTHGVKKALSSCIVCRKHFGEVGGGCPLQRKAAEHQRIHFLFFYFPLLCGLAALAFFFFFFFLQYLEYHNFFLYIKCMNFIYSIQIQNKESDAELNYGTRMGWRAISGIRPDADLRSAAWRRNLDIAFALGLRFSFLLRLLRAFGFFDLPV